jgi:LmbE family N-acetylglucosaminyl deacetylase
MNTEWQSSIMNTCGEIGTFLASSRLLAKVRGRTAKQAREILGVRQEQFLGQRSHVLSSVGINEKK